MISAVCTRALVQFIPSTEISIGTSYTIIQHYTIPPQLLERLETLHNSTCDNEKVWMLLLVETWLCSLSGSTGSQCVMQHLWYWLLKLCTGKHHNGSYASPTSFPKTIAPLSSQDPHSTSLCALVMRFAAKASKGATIGRRRPFYLMAWANETCVLMIKALGLSSITLWMCVQNPPRLCRHKARKLAGKSGADLPAAQQRKPDLIQTVKLHSFQNPWSPMSTSSSLGNWETVA